MAVFSSNAVPPVMRRKIQRVQGKMPGAGGRQKQVLLHTCIPKQLVQGIGKDQTELNDGQKTQQDNVFLRMRFPMTEILQTEGHRVGCCNRSSEVIYHICCID